MSEQPVLPYVVVRLIAAVYARVPIIWTDAPQRPTGPLFVPGPLPANPFALTDEERERVLVAALEMIRANRLRCCVVFAEDDTVYLERDGSREAGLPKPSGGVLPT